MLKLHNKKLGGFTLLEIVVVSSIMIFMTSLLFTTFGGASRHQQAVRRVASALQADLRKIESLAVSGRDFIKDPSSPICGYGLRYVSKSQYQIYKRVAVGIICSTINHNYQTSADNQSSPQNLVDPNVEFGSSFQDIFFEPPDPKVYINNDASLNQPGMVINICYKGTSDCKNVVVYTTGRIEVQ